LDGWIAAAPVGGDPVDVLVAGVCWVGGCCDVGVCCEVGVC
jgi:hypothetical protein